MTSQRGAASAAVGRAASDRLLDAGVLAFAAFTLLANLASFGGMGLHRLTQASAAMAVAGLVFAAARRLWRPPPAPAPARFAACDSEDDAPPSTRLRIAVLVAAAACSGLLAATQSLSLFCGLALLLTGGLLLRELGSAPRLVDTPLGVGPQSLLCALGLLCAAAVLVAHHGDADDAFYVNQVVTAVDHPEAPILRYDGLHGLGGVPLQLPVFAVLSLEPFEAVLARVSGLSALFVAHLLVPAFAAFLLPFASARLLRRLLPGRWLWGVAAALAWLFCVGDGQSGYGDFALLRLQQGKSLMLHLTLPLVLCHGIEFAQAPGRRRFVLLAAAQICAVGLSTTGLWLAPTTAGVGLVCGLCLRAETGGMRYALRTLAVGLAASLHPLGLALWLRAATLRVFAEAAHPLPAEGWSGLELVAHARSLVLGDGAAGAFALFAILVAWVAADSALLRRFCALCGFVFLLFWNPLTAPFLAQQVTGADAYFRVFWLLPLPALVAVVLTGPLAPRFAAGRLPASARGPVAALAAALLLAWLPEVYTLSAANDVRLARPGFKVPEVAFEAALEMARHARSGQAVLAPTDVAVWIPLLHEHPAPLVVREILLDVVRPRLGGAELERRVLLTHLVAGELRPADGGALLATAISDYPLAAVCLAGRAIAFPELRGALLASPLRVVRRHPQFEVWARPAGEPDAPAVR